MTYHLQIVTPDGLYFDGQAERLTVPTTEGPVTILARHINYVTALGMGPAKVVTEQGERIAACIGGMVAVTGSETKVVATTFEWADEIDVDRAQASLEKAQALLEKPDLERADLQAAQARLKRAQVRLSVAKQGKE